MPDGAAVPAPPYRSAGTTNTSAGTEVPAPQTGMPTNLTPWSRDFSPGGQAKVSSPTHTALEGCPNSPRDDHRQVTSFDGFVAGRVGGVDSHRIPPWLESSRV